MQAAAATAAITESQVVLGPNDFTLESLTNCHRGYFIANFPPGTCVGQLTIKSLPKRNQLLKKVQEIPVVSVKKGILHPRAADVLILTLTLNHGPKTEVNVDTIRQK